MAVNQPNPPGHADTVDLYDLFDALIDRVPWRTETERAQYKELIVELRKINLFGYMAYRVTVDKQWDSARQTIPTSSLRELPPRRY